MVDTAIIIPKYTPLNYIDDVWEPKYSENMVYIAKHKIDRSKNDIHLTFPKVNETSGYYGDWFISLKEVKRGRKTFNNNGLACYAVDFSKFRRFKRGQDMREIW